MRRGWCAGFNSSGVRADCGGRELGLFPGAMSRLLVSLLIAIGLAFAPALMARAAAASGPAAAMEHCKGAVPATHHGKADASPCCTTACPMTAALPSSPAPERIAAKADMQGIAPSSTFAGFDPERETPPPRRRS